MNPVKASHLLRLIQKHSDLSKPVKPQLHQLFIPTFWNGNLVLRHSWQGKIAAFLQYPSEYKAVEEKVIRIFAQAIDQADLNCVDTNLGIKLRHEFGCGMAAPLSLPWLTRRKSKLLQNLKKATGRHSSPSNKPKEA